MPDHLTVFPGVIDAHVHFNEPGRTDWEGFATGSRAAAAGGTTTVFDMPLNAHPPTIDGPAFDAKRTAAESQSLVDFATLGWTGARQCGSTRNTARSWRRRDQGIHVATAGSTISPRSIRKLLRAGMQTRRRARSSRRGACGVGRNDPRSARSNELAAGKTSVRDYLDSRSVHAELEAIKRAIDLAGEIALPLAHCACQLRPRSCTRGGSASEWRRCYLRDLPALSFLHRRRHGSAWAQSRSARRRCGPRKIKPSLWRRIADVTTIGSDHSPSPWQMKERSNFFDVWGGISGCQHLLPLLIDAGKLSPGDVTRLTSTAVAKRFGIAGKGGIEIGNDADLTLVDVTRRGDRQRGVAALSASPQSVCWPHPPRANCADTFAGTNNLREW